MPGTWSQQSSEARTGNYYEAPSQRCNTCCPLLGTLAVLVALYAGPIARYNDGAGRLYEDGHGGWASDYVLELAYPPFSYILGLEEDRPAVQMACITNFAELGPDQRADVELLLLVGFGHTQFPLDFRTHAMLARDWSSVEIGCDTAWRRSPS